MSEIEIQNIVNKESTNKTRSGKQIAIEGMLVFKEVLNEKSEKELLEFFDREFNRRGILPDEYKPRTMYYGIKNLDCDEIIPPFPEEIKPLLYQLFYKEILDRVEVPECLEIKEYTRLQGVIMKQPEEYNFFVMITLGDPWCCFVETPDYGGTTLGVKLLPRLCITFNDKNCNYTIPKNRRQSVKNITLSRKPNFKLITMTFKKLKPVE